MKVLLATDFSAGSARAARLAARIAPDAASLATLHVVSPLGAASVGQSGWVGIAAPPVVAPGLDVRTVEAQLARWCAEHDVPGTSFVREGLPGRVVADEARRMGADLVVLGATGASGVERVLLGSVANAIVRSLGCSALVARGEAVAFRKMLFATDFGTPAERAAELAARLPGFEGADLVAAHVRESDAYDPHPELAEFNRGSLGGRAREVVEVGPPVRTLLRIAEREGADLLVVGNEGHGFFERAILGDVAGGLVERAPCSVLVGRPPE